MKRNEYINTGDIGHELYADMNNEESPYDTHSQDARVKSKETTLRALLRAIALIFSSDHSVAVLGEMQYWPSNQ